MDAGLAPAEALRGATSLAADTFGLTDRGVIALGHRADLVLVDGDPTRDISAPLHPHDLGDIISRVLGRPIEVREIDADT